MSIIDEARKNAAVDALYLEVDASAPIEIVEVKGVDWSSKSTDGKTTIEVGEAEHPDAALYHELLHAKLKLGGYIQYVTAVATNTHGQNAKNILSAIDNELQHHRMFSEFARAGFSPEKFYNDDDSKSLKSVRNRIKKSPPNTIIDAFFVFLTLIAPGGHGSDKERGQAKNLLFAKVGPKGKETLLEIEEDFKEWANGSSLDASRTIQSVLHKLKFDKLWVGSSKNFPADGFFVGDDFSLSEAEDFLKTRK